MIETLYMIFAVVAAICLPLIVAGAIRWKSPLLIADVPIVLVSAGVGFYRCYSGDGPEAATAIGVAFAVALFVAMFARILHLLIRRKAEPKEGSALNAERSGYFLIWGGAYVLAIPLIS